MNEKKGLSLVTAASIFAGLLTLFVGDRVIERVMDGDQETRTKVLVGAACAFGIVALLSGLTYLYAAGPAGLVRIFQWLLVLVLVSAFFWDGYTTFIGVYSIVLPSATPVKAFAASAIISAIVYTVMLSAGVMLDGKKPTFWVVLYFPLLLCVLSLDFWTCYRGTAYFLWTNLEPNTLPHDQWVILVAVATSVCVGSITLGIVVPRLLSPATPALSGQR